MQRRVQLLCTCVLALLISPHSLQVHSQISHLFRSAPDLLKEFLVLTPLALGVASQPDDQPALRSKSRPSSKSDGKKRKRKNSSSTPHLEQQPSIQESGEVDAAKATKSVGSTRKAKKRKVQDETDDVTKVRFRLRLSFACFSTLTMCSTLGKNATHDRRNQRESASIHP